MQPIRILHVLGRLDYGGIESMLMNIYRNIDREKIQFDFVIHTTEECDYSNEIITLGGVIHHAPRFNGINIINYIKFWHFFFKENARYRVVHGHMRSTASIYLFVAKIYKRVTISHSHSTGSRGNFIEKKAKRILQFPIKLFSDYLFACSKDAAKWLYGNKVANEGSYKLLKNSIDLEKYERQNEEKGQIKTKLKINHNFVIGHVGSFTEPKNHNFIIEIFSEYTKINKNALLVLVGEGDLKKEIISKVNLLELSENVLFVGSVDNVHEYLKVMDIFIFPSIFEGLGIALIEAQAAGIKAVVSNNIPEEAIQTGIIERVDLNTSPQEWANVINVMSKKKLGEDINPIVALRNAGYDVKIEAEKMQFFYLNLANNLSH